MVWGSGSVEGKWHSPKAPNRQTNLPSGGKLMSCGVLYVIPVRMAIWTIPEILRSPRGSGKGLGVWKVYCLHTLCPQSTGMKSIPISSVDPTVLIVPFRVWDPHQWSPPEIQCFECTLGLSIACDRGTGAMLGPPLAPSALCGNLSFDHLEREIRSGMAGSFQGGEAWKWKTSCCFLENWSCRGDLQVPCSFLE